MRNFFTVSAICVILLISCNTAKDESDKITSQKEIKQTPQDPLKQSVARGREIYMELCATCHLPSGKGVSGAFPPLHPSDWLTDKRTESIHAVKYGLKGEIIVNGQPYNNIMLPLGLSDDEVRDVMNFTIQTWNEGEMVTLEEVQAVTK
ncbi:c-type cytochrome [Nonlabens ponticola]|uniref:Cytochrome c n=1 Tax=Nonlabens ponticola TaxID=2496866 RepID=A0A3S9MZZ6_9FLAO|nr:cytochrome c [Nonlabens ponticola]AZQ44652.1 cytochrome c [Nonlabens ponticola]